jgi:mannan endo-1,4-beta-mannosidase
MNGVKIRAGAVPYGALNEMGMVVCKLQLTIFSKNCFAFALALGLLFAVQCCKKSSPTADPGDQVQTGYYTIGAKLMYDECEWEFRGTNKMSAFSDWNFDGPAAYGMDISRECIDMKCTPDIDLQCIVQAARAKGFVTILTAFWWDSDAFPGGTTPYPECQILGATPSQDHRFTNIQTRWQQIARLFKNQSDVWFGVWNEPYEWRKEETASSAQWLEDAVLLVDNIRETGAENIIVLCGYAMGQGHEPFLEKGAELLAGRKNIVFDIHAYRTYWDISSEQIEARLKVLKTTNSAPVIIGEFAANGEQPYVNIMEACRNTKTSLLAWLWGQYHEPFLSQFGSYCLESRNTTCPSE